MACSTVALDTTIDSRLSEMYRTCFAFCIIEMLKAPEHNKLTEINNLSYNCYPIVLELVKTIFFVLNSQFKCTNLVT